MSAESVVETKRIKRRNRIKLTRGDIGYQFVINTIVALFAMACFVPFLYVVSMSLTSYGEMMEKSFFVLWPEHPNLRSYEIVLGNPSFVSSVLVSVARVILGTFASLVLVVPGGYILANKLIPGRKAILIFFVLALILPTGMIPNYLLLRTLNLLDTFWVYIFPAMGGTFSMLIIKLFVENLPTELMESAELDGATEMQKMFSIAIPLLLPTIAALALFAAVAHWNSWFDAMLYNRSVELMPLSLLARNLVTAQGTISDTNNFLTVLERTTPEGIRMATVVLAVVPILCVYPFLQKYFIYGMFTGSVKG